MPVKISGSAEGRTISKNRFERLEPSDTAAMSRSIGSDRTPAWAARQMMFIANRGRPLPQQAENISRAFAKFRLRPIRMTRNGQMSSGMTAPRSQGSHRFHKYASAKDSLNAGASSPNPCVDGWKTAAYICVRFMY